MRLTATVFAGSTLLACLFALSASSCPAQGVQGGEPPKITQPPKAPIAHGSITGHVLCGDTRTPARGARLIILPMSQFEAQTKGTGIAAGPGLAVAGLDGGFFVPNLPAGEYAVFAMMAGYMTPVDGITNPPTSPHPDNKTLYASVRQYAKIVRISPIHRHQQPARHRHRDQAAARSAAATSRAGR